MTHMTRLNILRTTAVGLALLCGQQRLLAAKVKAEERPNILFLLIDDQRNDTLGCAGHPIIKTPVIDSLAYAGTRYKNAFVTTAICAASRSSIFTGLHERTHGYTFGKPPLNKFIMANSYPRLMRNAGYRTGFIGKYGVKTEGKPESEMFDFYIPHDRTPFLIKQPDGSLRHESEVAGDKAIEFLEGNPKGKPFCLSISFKAVHANDGDLENHYPGSKAVEGMYEDIKIPPPRLSDPSIFENHPDFLKNSKNRKRYHWRWDTPEKYQKNMKAYFRMISGVDHVIGRIRKELDKLNLSDNTVIIYMGDNGYYMGDRGFAGKWSHYDQALRVPMIICDPRLPKDKCGIVKDEMALNIDIPTTMLQLAGVKIPSHYQGRNLLQMPSGENNSSWRKDFFCEHLMENKTIPKWEGIRDERYVYARYFGQKPAYEFLHDLKSDPDELINLAKNPEYKSILAKMSKRCDELKDEYTNKK